MGRDAHEVKRYADKFDRNPAGPPDGWFLDSRGIARRKHRRVRTKSEVQAYAIRAYYSNRFRGIR